MTTERLLTGTSPMQFLCLGIIGYLTYGIFRALYNIYFHPLSSFPGPKLRAGFYFPFYYDRLTGDYINDWHELHEKYGEVVRIAPHILSTISPDAWRVAPDKDHTRMRRSINHAFSEQALRSQENIITGYITFMISKLHARAQTQTPIDVTRWMNATTFDITGDLAFGEPFGALEADACHSWIENTFAGLKWVRLMAPLRAYPIFGVPIFALLRRWPALEQARKRQFGYLDEKLERRLRSKTDRNDFLRLTSGLLIIAGSETSATCLSGAVYYLLKNPTWITCLLSELRSAFKNESEMSFQSLSHLKVLQAVIQESLRMYPPLPVDMPRMTPPEGATVCGAYIPPHTSISIPHYPAYHSHLNFKDPDTFAPERWLGDEKYADDRRSVLQPFSMGSRNCIGQNLAWAEMRSILARLVWSFEMELLPESEGWDQGQKIYLLWFKPALMVRLRAREVE
ncbi:cytochrome P450 monooxygenase-like protein [Macroventuria anomochaeta]|uniref:Cytochrome P450 monooxygenase-like protein n=1 Tax=Macroventuria anomochaeta TaxID=301207 RepID=A0ACB6RYV6_9PLEO|nr:cytochrome P450 monooxygenase-like protein [Macroventuria anomochaeta]KAF2626333.1 cytochrome P450 monooxygenase-like protein [Macroventuria anomochaeta]